MNPGTAHLILKFGDDELSKSTPTETDYQPSTKPPLGVEPRHLFLERRLSELCRAVHESIESGNGVSAVPPSGVNPHWLLEIKDIIKTLKPNITLRIGSQYQTDTGQVILKDHFKSTENCIK